MTLLDGHADIAGRLVIASDIENDGDGPDLSGRCSAANVKRRDQRHHQCADKPQQGGGLHRDGERGGATAHGAE